MKTSSFVYRLVSTVMLLGGLSLITACSLLTVSVQVPSSPFVQEISYDSMLTVVAKSSLPVFIEEYDPAHCGPGCRKQHEVVNDLAVQYRGKFNFYRVTTSEAEFKAGRYPVYYAAKATLQVYNQTAGIKSEAELKSFIDQAYAAMYPPDDSVLNSTTNPSERPSP